jgi:hypothetical protein
MVSNSSTPFPLSIQTIEFKMVKSIAGSKVLLLGSGFGMCILELLKTSQGVAAPQSQLLPRNYTERN